MLSGSLRYRLSDSNGEILAVKELCFISQTLVSCLRKRSFDATPHKPHRSRLNGRESASSGRLNKHSLINPLCGISDEMPHGLEGSRICLTPKISPMISESRICSGAKTSAALLKNIVNRDYQDLYKQPAHPVLAVSRTSCKIGSLASATWCPKPAGPAKSPVEPSVIEL